MKLLLLCGLAAVCLFAQQPSVLDVNMNEGPSRHAYQTVLGYDGSNNLSYRCRAFSSDSSGARRLINVSISAATNANPAVFTSTGHGFSLSSRPKVTISGGTGNWAAVNGAFTATVVDANTFSIPVNSTSLGAVAGTLEFTTTAPRTTVPEWSVELFAYDASNNLTGMYWLNGTPTFSSKCSEASLTTTNIQ